MLLPFLACSVDADGFDGGGYGGELGFPSAAEEGGEEPALEDEDGAEIRAVVATIAEDILGDGWSKEGWMRGR